MSDQGLPTLDELWDQNFGDGQDDGPDGGFEEVEAPVAPAPQSQTTEAVVEQSIEDSEVPAKLSDLFKENSTPEGGTQSDDSGQAESGPIDLDTEIEVDGQRITVRELARQRDEMRKDYTQKTQTLAQERQQFEAERNELMAAKDIRDMLKENPVSTIAEMALRAGIISEDTYEEALRSNRRVSADKVLPDPNSNVDLETRIQEEVDRRLQEALANDPARQQYEIQQLQNQIGSAFASIEEAHGVELDDDDRRVIMQQAVAMNEGNLEYVYMKLNEQLRRQQAEKKRIQNGAPKRSQRGPQPADEAAPPERFDSLRDAWRFVEAQVGA